MRKHISIYLLTIISVIAGCQVLSPKSVITKLDRIQVDSVDWSKVELRCGVAHGTEDGWFCCDYNGHYYPYHIFDSTIRRWFIKVVNGDSLFYYRHDVVDIYVWNGRPKDQEYGYESESMRNTGGGETLPDKYTTDTLKIKRQNWNSKK